MSFSHFYTIQNPAAMFTCCPQCSMSLVVNIPNSVARFFQASEDNAHGTYCPNKKCPNKFRFDKAGLLRTRYDLWCWHTARERQLLAGEDGKVPKRGTPTEPQVLLPKRIIKKEIAAICADARDVRFHQEKRVKFKDVILKTTHCKSEQNKFIDIRTTILLLVEHCTAWLYIHRKLSAARDLKTLPSKLFQQLMSVERKIEDGKLDILTDMNLLESETLKLISAFVKLLQLKVEATKAALAASGVRCIGRKLHNKYIETKLIALQEGSINRIPPPWNQATVFEKYFDYPLRRGGLSLFSSNHLQYGNLLPGYHSTMSLCEDEAYHHDYEKLVTKGSYLRSRRSLHQQRRRSADNAILTKTLLDPAGVLSKKQKNRLLSARDNDFQFDVPYSLNKHCRWETVNPKSLLLNSTEFDHDVLVADAVANSSCSEPALDYRVQKVHLLDDDALTTLSTTGKAKELAFFNEALREWKDKPKDEPDTARIQFNIIKNSSSHHPSPMSPKRRKRKPFTARKLVNDVELHDYYSDESCVDDDSTVEGEAEEYELPSLALSDFITESCSCGANHVLSTPTANTQPSPSGKVELECLTPLELADISQAIRMDCIFKVLDIKRSQLKPFDLHEKVSSLVPNLHHGQFVVHWFDKTRVSISNQPLADIVFIIFFELKDNLNTL
ncbi:hypothetical protein NECAME_11077, partial [Necator americanus]